MTDSREAYERIERKFSSANEVDVERAKRLLSETFESCALSVNTRDRGYVTAQLSEINSLLSTPTKADEQVSVPNGWRLMPERMTPKMVVGAMSAMDEIPFEECGATYQHMVAAWNALLDNSPFTAGQEGK